MSSKSFLGLLILLLGTSMLLAFSEATKLPKANADAKIDWILEAKVRADDTMFISVSDLKLYFSSDRNTLSVGMAEEASKGGYILDLKRIQAHHENWNRKSWRNRSRTISSNVFFNVADWSKLKRMELLTAIDIQNSEEKFDSAVENGCGSRPYAEIHDVVESKYAMDCLHALFTDSILDDFSQKIVPESWLKDPTCDLIKGSVKGSNSCFNTCYCLVLKLDGIYCLFQLAYYQKANSGFQDINTDPLPEGLELERLSLFTMRVYDTTWVHLQDIPIRGGAGFSLTGNIDTAPFFFQMGGAGYCIGIPSKYEYSDEAGSRYFFLFSDLKSGFRDSVLEEPIFFRPNDLIQDRNPSQN